MFETLDLQGAFVQVMDTVPDAIILADQNSRLLHVNEKTCQMFGYARDDLIGETIDILMPRKYRDAHHAQVSHYFSELRVRPMGVGKTLYAIDSSGKEFPVEISLSPMHSERKVYVIAAIRNVTERIRAQQLLEEYNIDLLQSNQDLEQFAYVASHDLQEPLRIITSFTQLLEKRYKDKLDSEGEEFVEFIVDAAQRMKMLINDLLAYSRLNQQHQRLGAVDLNEVLATVESNIRTSITEANATLRIGNLPVVYGDSTQLIQLFQNLLSNAIKFAKPDTPVEIDVDSESMTGDQYVISVRDNGIGIEERHQERIFSLFQRLHSNSQYPGTGIGLAICKRIIDRHKGEISIVSTKDQGSEFKVRLNAGSQEK